MRIIMCGSRTFNRVGVIRETLQKISASTDGPITIVHGDARGADRLAAEVAKWMGMQVEAVPADWDTHGKRAGYVRNQEMLDRGADAVYAFRSAGESRGTDMMVDLARKAGVETFLYRLDDE